MKITYKGDYALKAILVLSQRYGGDVLTITEIAQRIDAPVKFLEQVLLELKRGGFVASRRGKVGGYLLARPPSRITVGEVVRHIEGPLEPIACIREDYTDCKDCNTCAFRRLWQNVARSTEALVDGATFSDMVTQAQCAEQNNAYVI